MSELKLTLWITRRDTKECSPATNDSRSDPSKLDRLLPQNPGPTSAAEPVTASGHGFTATVSETGPTMAKVHERRHCNHRVRATGPPATMRFAKISRITTQSAPLRLRYQPTESTVGRLLLDSSNRSSGGGKNLHDMKEIVRDRSIETKPCVPLIKISL